MCRHHAAFNTVSARQRVKYMDLVRDTVCAFSFHKTPPGRRASALYVRSVAGALAMPVHESEIRLEFLGVSVHSS
jgi:hypothetical protein